ncbi:MAG: HAMP domain-containing sensor histidine kinase [Bacteroidia bacterium]|nr:HAMP domain-containing sensor histidine kinase [Bacteroidia bacterium]
MNKRIIIGLVFLMGISLLGIVAVQFYWFNNSVAVRNELFDRSVNEAMNKAVRRLETGHDLRIIRNFAAGDSLKWDERVPFPPPPTLGFENIDVMIKKDSIKGNITVITSKSRGTKSRSRSIKLQSIFGKSGNTFQHSKDTLVTFHDSMVLSEFPEIPYNTGKKIEQLEKLSKQIAIEYNGWETGRHIDEKQLKKLLKEELMDRAIPIDFNFTINPVDSILKTTTKISDHPKWYKVNLFPNDVFRKNLELAVYFPDRNLFIGRTTTLLLGLSVAFTMIIFLTFSLSIFLIIRQKKISEMKSDFINNMTHEFKTPIATISIAADSISNDKVIKDEEKVRFFTGMIKKENLRMNEQVERILQIARLDRKEFEFNFHAVNVHELIEEARNGILLQVEKKGGKINTKLEAVNPVVTTDPIHFTNLVYNLLDNANKYSPDEPLITVTTTNCPKGIYLTVEDKGIGMSKAVQTRIFDKFYRLTSGNIHNIKGFGLGLSYVKAILEANDGSIKVHSEPGKGSRFVVFIPFLINRR